MKRYISRRVSKDIEVGYRNICEKLATMLFQHRTGFSDVAACLHRGVFALADARGRMRGRKFKVGTIVDKSFNRVKKYGDTIDILKWIYYAIAENVDHSKPIERKHGRLYQYIADDNNPMCIDIQIDMQKLRQQIFALLGPKHLNAFVSQNRVAVEINYRITRQMISSKIYGLFDQVSRIVEDNGRSYQQSQTTVRSVLTLYRTELFTAVGPYQKNDKAFVVDMPQTVNILRKIVNATQLDTSLLFRCAQDIADKEKREQMVVLFKQLNKVSASFISGKYKLTGETDYCIAEASIPKLPSHLRRFSSNSSILSVESDEDIALHANPRAATLFGVKLHHVGGKQRQLRKQCLAVENDYIELFHEDADSRANLDVLTKFPNLKSSHSYVYDSGKSSCSEERIQEGCVSNAGPNM